MSVVVVVFSEYLTQYFADNFKTVRPVVTFFELTMWPRYCHTFRTVASASSTSTAELENPQKIVIVW